MDTGRYNLVEISNKHPVTDVGLSWLENAYSRPLFSAGDFGGYTANQIDLLFGMPSGFISRSVHAKLQNRAVTICVSQVRNPDTDRQHFDKLIC